MIFGSHVSCAGGLLQAAARAREATCDCIQIFVSSPRQWPAADLCLPVHAQAKTKKNAQPEPTGAEECSEWQAALKIHKLAAPIAHTSYLINLGTPDGALWNKSLDALVVEWRRCEQLQLEGLVMHPGAHTTSTPEQGLEQIALGVTQAIQRVKPKYCRLLLENTAGQGSCLGWQVEQLGWLLHRIGTKHVGVCWDTCHALAAGYDFRTAAGMKAMLAELEKHQVLEQIQAIHINDSMKDCGSRVDRHEHIGQGFIGEDGFQRFLRTRQFKNIPMYLETPKGNDETTGEDFDVMNLATLRRLSKR